MNKQILRKIESAEHLIEQAAEAGEENLTLTALEWLTAAVKDLANKVDELEAMQAGEPHNPIPPIESLSWNDDKLF